MSVDYFMDKCSVWELNDHYDNIKYADRNDWEQTRLLMYVIAQTNTSKKLDIKKDIMTLPWDNEHKKPEINVTAADVERMKQLAAQQLRKLHNQQE